MKLFIKFIEYICGAPEPIYQESNDEESNDYFFYDLETEESYAFYTNKNKIITYAA